jgi:hypothetical protein
LKLTIRDYETGHQIIETNPSIDFSQEIREYFLDCLKQGGIDEAREVKNNL